MKYRSNRPQDSNLQKTLVRFVVSIIVMEFFNISVLFSQIEKYFPVTTGNSWTYNEIVDNQLHTKQTISVVDTLQINGKTYYLFDRFFRAREIRDSSLFRIDGQKVLRNIGSIEQIWFDFSAELNSSWPIELYDSDLDTTVQVLVELTSKSMRQTINGRDFDNCYVFYLKNLYATEHDWSYTFAPDFGCVEVWCGTSVPVYYKFREGIIEGIEYPDLISNIHKIDQISNPELPAKFSLSQNFPNPFNPETTIRFDIPEKASVKIEISNLMGQHISTLFDGERNAGSYEVRWNGIDKSGQAVVSGVYLCKMTAGNFLAIRKMALVR